MVAVTVALGLTIAAPAPSFGQAPADLGTAGDFGVLAGSTVTNTGTSVINGNVGVSPGSAIVGFPPGIVNGTFHAADAVALQAQSDLTAAYTDLESRASDQDLSGQDLGGLTLTAGVYTFNASAQLTGTLTLNGEGDPNSVFIFQIASTLTTASNSSILLINGAQGSNVFFQVGESATLGTTTTFAGNILALTSITLNTGATIICGSALAQNGAVTLDSNTITTCNRAAQLAQDSGEVGTGAALAAVQAMNSLLSLLTSPFSDAGRPFADDGRDSQPIVVKGFAPEGTQSSVRSAFASFDGSRHRGRWGIWGSVYGSRSNAAGDPAGAGTHDRTASSYGFATGLDYRVNDNTIAGFALAGGETHFGLSDSLGSGSSNMFQAAVYSTTRVNAAYLSAALAYSWHEVSTNRVTLTGVDRLVADYSAHNWAARIEGGYRYSLPSQPYWKGKSGITPYAAIQAQLFRTPSYSESAESGSAVLALAYEARTTTTARTELGAWYDWSASIDPNTFTSVRARLAWVHDFWSSPELTASFVALPETSFVVKGAKPDSDLLLASIGAETSFRNGYSLAARFDAEFAENTQNYSATGRLRYRW